MQQHIHLGDINRIGILQVHRVYREETSRLCSNQTQRRYKQNRNIAGSQSLQRGNQQIMQQLDIEEIQIEQEYCRFIEFIERKLVDYVATRHRGDINRIGILQFYRVYREETNRLCSNQTQRRHKQNRNTVGSQSLQRGNQQIVQQLDREEI